MIDRLKKVLHPRTAQELLLDRETIYKRQKKVPTFTCIEECLTSDILKLRKKRQIMKCLELQKLPYSGKAYYIVAKLPIQMVTQSHLLIIKEKVNSENLKGAPTFPSEENHRLPVMNSQHSSNPY
jgi:hypothetical protein